MVARSGALRRGAHLAGAEGDAGDSERRKASQGFVGTAAGGTRFGKKGAV